MQQPNIGRRKLLPPKPPQQPQPNHRANAASRAQGAASRGPCLLETQVQGEKQSLVLFGAWNSSLASRTTTHYVEPCPDWGLIKNWEGRAAQNHCPPRWGTQAGRKKRARAWAQQCRTAVRQASGNCATSQGPILQKFLVQLIVRPSLVSYLEDLMALS